MEVLAENWHFRLISTLIHTAQTGNGGVGRQQGSGKARGSWPGERKRLSGKVLSTIRLKKFPWKQRNGVLVMMRAFLALRRGKGRERGESSGNVALG